MSEIKKDIPLPTEIILSNLKSKKSMKKSLLSLAVACVAPASVNAQSFNHLGISVEAGVHGAGVNLTAPILDKHLYLTLGYNFPAVNYDMDVDVSAGEFNKSVQSLNTSIEQYNTISGDNLGKAKPFNQDITVKASADIKLFNNAKALLQYFPSSSHSFHFTAGVMIGQEDFLNLSGDIDKASWANYQGIVSNAQNLNSKLPTDQQVKIDDKLRFKIDEQVMEIDNNGHVEADVTYSKIKPYFGIGFGKAIPENKRVGFQFELGAWYHGTPKIESQCENTSTDPETVSEGIDGVGDILSKIQVMPTITFRITGRLF